MLHLYRVLYFFVDLIVVFLSVIQIEICLFQVSNKNNCSRFTHAMVKFLFGYLFCSSCCIQDKEIYCKDLIISCLFATFTVSVCCIIYYCLSLSYKIDVLVFCTSTMFVSFLIHCLALKFPKTRIPSELLCFEKEFFRIPLLLISKIFSQVYSIHKNYYDIILLSVYFDIALLSPVTDIMLFGCCN